MWLTVGGVGPARAQVSQAGPWLQYAAPEEAGWSGAALDAARSEAERLGSAAVMVVYRGHVVAAWGDVARKLETHSIRKTLLNALYGIAVAEGRVDLSTTLGELGIEDRGPLTESERSATIEHLLRSRSGVFVPAAYAPREQDEARPQRDRYPPGRAFFYNNWDFNVLGSILDRLGGPNLFVQFAERIAAPLGMEDYEPGDGFYALEPSRSDHPAYTFRMSTRDLARYGVLWTRRGMWGDTRILSEAWVDASWSSPEPLADGRGYGYLWHLGAPGVFPAGSPLAVLDPYERYVALGTGGQMMMVLPELDLVLVHRGDTDHDRRLLDPSQGRTIRDVEVLGLFAMILAARTGEATAEPRTAPLSPAPLSSVRPALPERTAAALSPAEIDEYVGRYRLGRGGEARVFRFGGDRLFLSNPAEGELELFRLEGDVFFARMAAQLTIEFLRDGSARVRAIRASEPGTTVTAERIDG